MTNDPPKNTSMKRIMRWLLNNIRTVAFKLTNYNDHIDVVEHVEKRNSLEELGTLTATIEHDIRSPISIMQSEIYELKRKFHHNDEIIHPLEKLEKQLDRIDVSLSYIRLSRGNTDFFERVMEKTELVSLINRAVKVVKSERNTGNIYFSVSGKNLFIKAYRPMLERAIVSILNNSVEAIQEGSHRRGTIFIHLKYQGPDKEARIEIVDNGCGIQPENIHKLTTIFSTKKHTGPNRGLGLFLVAKIVELHQGNLYIKSNYSEGTQISLTFPTWEQQYEE